jgi:hypothetical protein
MSATVAQNWKQGHTRLRVIVLVLCTEPLDRLCDLVEANLSDSRIGLLTQKNWLHVMEKNKSTRHFSNK